MPMKPPKPTKKYTPGRKRKTKKIVYKTGSKMRGSARRKITAKKTTKKYTLGKY